MSPERQQQAGSAGLYTPEERARRDATRWTLVQGLLADMDAAVESARAVTYAAWPRRSFATSVSSTSTRTRSASSLAIVAITVSGLSATLSPAFRRLRSTTPEIGERMTEIGRAHV